MGNRRDTVATIGLNVVSGILNGLALLATTGVLEALFAAGPTPGRVRAALPSLILVAAAVAGRAGLQAAAGWAQARLHPQVDRVVEIRLPSVKHADRIYVLRDGQVIEQGVHADLLALGGQYAELFTLQAAQYNL